jgi:hypothetical protein
MSYESVDALQQALTKDIFHYAKDAKKAAGRALGTLVEIINFYLLKAWGYENYIAIERRIPEYANPELTHNVEFTLHPTEKIANFQLKETDLPFTAAKIRKQVKTIDWKKEGFKSTQLLSKTGLLRNSCIVYECDNELVVAYLADQSESGWNIFVEKLRSHPFAMFECKRVGVEEGIKKGPQTIEKAKQGAYVARVVSSLQKLRMADGSIYGVLHLGSGKLRYEPDDLLLKPDNKYREVKDAFKSSYTGAKGKNKFTKVQMTLTADKAIQEYFRQNLADIESWFNVISPAKMTVDELKNELKALSSKNWREILK